MKKIFITGGIGSGKSTLLAFLAGQGVATIEADKVGHDNLKKPEVKARLREAFGDDIFDDCGEVVRPALAAKAFVSPEATARLDSITLKYLYQECLHRIDVLGKNHDYVALEMAILDGRDDFYKNADIVVALTARPETRIKRLVERGLTEADARERLANQVSDAMRIAIADVVLTNDGTLDEFEAEIRHWWDSFIED